MKVRMHRLPESRGRGYVAAVKVPAGTARLAVVQVAPRKAQALQAAAAIADRIMRDPVLSAVIPPQAFAAVATAKALGSAASKGSRQLRRLWRRLRGPGSRRLAAALREVR